MPGRTELLDAERGAYQKKWTGRHPVALIYPNIYHVGMSSLGFQLVYSILNEQPQLVCERFFLPERDADPKICSFESGRPLDQFPIIFVALSFEHDYENLVEILLRAGIEPLAASRSTAVTSSSPLIVGGGVATFINPEPIAPFFDLILIGEAEPVLANLSQMLTEQTGNSERKSLLSRICATFPSCYVPAAYEAQYSEDGNYSGYSVLWPEAPARVQRSYLRDTDTAGHSQLTSKNTEFSEMHLVELGRGCSRSCRFCAAGFVYRPPRKWSESAIFSAIESRFSKIEKVGLLGMEMTETAILDRVVAHLQEKNCQLSFSSLRADAISEQLVNLLAQSTLKTVAIAPDGCSERLRRVINKNLSEADIIHAAERVVESGIQKLKLYLMVGLPTETDADLAEALALIEKLKDRIDRIGRRRGRLTEILLSVNCFIPKAWTPFQYHAFGSSDKTPADECRQVDEVLREMKRRLRFLSVGVQQYANVHMQSDKPENALYQAVLAKGDRRLAPVLIEMASAKTPWRQALKKHNLTPEIFALRGYDGASKLPWYSIDHGIDPRYLWREYERAFEEKLTQACSPDTCRACGVCHE